jgi:hypothetical protein
MKKKQFDNQTQKTLQRTQFLWRNKIKEYKTASSNSMNAADLELGATESHIKLIKL